MIKAVIFDFGGVLAATGKRGYISQVVAELFGVPFDRIDIGDLHGDLRRGRSAAADFIAELNRRYGAKKQINQSDFMAKTHEVVINELVMNLARELRQRGLVTGILSNVFEMNADVLRSQGYYDGFEPLILSYATGYAKPDPEIYDLMIRLLAERGIQPEETLFVDDQEKCIGPAHAKGTQVILAESPEQTAADIKALLKAQNNLDL